MLPLIQEFVPYALKAIASIPVFHFRTRHPPLRPTGPRTGKVQTSSSSKDYTPDPQGGRSVGHLRRFHHGTEDVFTHNGRLPDDVRAGIESPRPSIRLA